MQIKGLILKAWSSPGFQYIFSCSARKLPWLPQLSLSLGTIHGRKCILRHFPLACSVQTLFSQAPPFSTEKEVTGSLKVGILSMTGMDDWRGCWSLTREATGFPDGSVSCKLSLALWCKMYSVCTRIEMIIFNKRGKTLPNPFYKLPHLCHVLLPWGVLHCWQGLGTLWSLVGGKQGDWSQWSRAWGCHAANQGTTERPLQRWVSLDASACASHWVKDGPDPCLNHRILLPA